MQHPDDFDLTSREENSPSQLAFAYAIDLTRQEAVQQALCEGYELQAVLCPTLLAVACETLREACEEAEKLPLVPPSHPRFEAQIELRSVLKKQIREYVEEFLLPFDV